MREKGFIVSDVNPLHVPDTSNCKQARAAVRVAVFVQEERKMYVMNDDFNIERSRFVLWC